MYIAYRAIHTNPEMRNVQSHNTNLVVRISFRYCTSLPSERTRLHQIPRASFTVLVTLKSCDPVLLWLSTETNAHAYPSFLYKERSAKRVRTRTQKKMDSEFHLRATTTTTTATSGGDAHPPRIKPPPQSASISAPFSYSPSDDGTDENLLVLLHGLGSHRPFFPLFSRFQDGWVKKTVLFFF